MAVFTCIRRTKLGIRPSSILLNLLLSNNHTSNHTSNQTTNHTTDRPSPTMPPQSPPRGTRSNTINGPKNVQSSDLAGCTCILTKRKTITKSPLVPESKETSTTYGPEQSCDKEPRTNIPDHDASDAHETIASNPNTDSHAISGEPITLEGHFTGSAPVLGEEETISEEQVIREEQLNTDNDANEGLLKRPRSKSPERRLSISEADSSTTISGRSLKRPRHISDDTSRATITSIPHSDPGGRRELENAFGFEKEQARFAVYQPSFKRADAMIEQACRKTTKAIKKQKRREKACNALMAKIEAIHHPAEQDTKSCSVVLIGPTGSGKTKLICQLLDHQHVALASDNGGSGTHVPQEFRRKETGQSCRFRSRGYYIEDWELEKETAKACADYYKWIHRDPDPNDDSLDELRKNYNHAIEWFASFLVEAGSDAEFESIQALEKCLDGLKRESDSKTIRRLSNAIINYLNSNRDNSVTTLDSDDLEELNRMRQCYDSPNKHPKTGTHARSVWYAIYHFTTYLDAEILEDGLVLVDLPGMSDKCPRRVKSANDYMDSCDNHVIVSPIQRFETDDMIDNLLNTNLRRGILDKTILVPTKIDCINPGESREYPAADKEELGRLRQDASSKKAEYDAVNKEFYDAIENDNLLRDPLREIRERRVAKKQELGLAEAAVSEKDKLSRNEKVRKNCHEEFEKTIRDYDLAAEVPPMFFVANGTYAKHMSYKEHDPERKMLDLTLWETGIPQLRQHLRATLAKKRHEDQKSRAADLELYLSGLSLYCSKSKLELKNIVRNELKMVVSEFENDLMSVVPGILADVDKHQKSVVNEHEERWKKNAEAMYKSWGMKVPGDGKTKANIHHASLDCICKNRGRHVSRSTLSKTSWNLNGNIAKKMGKATVYFFKELKRTVDSAEKIYDAAATARLAEIETKMRSTYS